MHNRNPRREGGTDAAGHHGLHATDERLVQFAGASQRTVRRQQRQHIVPAAVDEVSVVVAHNLLSILGKLVDLPRESAVRILALQRVDGCAHPVPVGDQNRIVAQQLFGEIRIFECFAQLAGARADFFQLPMGKTPALFRLAFLADAPKVLLEKQIAQVVNPEFILSVLQVTVRVERFFGERLLDRAETHLARGGHAAAAQNALDERDGVQRLARLEAEFGVLLGVCRAR
jgi:hypothetical protein